MINAFQDGKKWCASGEKIARGCVRVIARRLRVKDLCGVCKRFGWSKGGGGSPGPRPAPLSQKCIVA